MRIPSRQVIGNCLGGSVRRRAVTGSAALAVSLLALQSLSAGTAEAFDGPNGHHQFVQISTRGAPAWGAKMVLRVNGGAIYHWNHGYRNEGDGVLTAHGGKQTWWFTAGENAAVEVSVAAVDGDDAFGENNKETKVFSFEPGKPSTFANFMIE